MFYVFVEWNFVDGEVGVDVFVGMCDVYVFVGLNVVVFVFDDFYVDVECVVWMEIGNIFGGFGDFFGFDLLN